ncbi:hypothetical protein [Streptomyces sp. NPDC058657]|uniref:hypothetical protein n=1 Tax=unclassified Streptomyces TaxID=2593676 RepID=UPI0036597B36
MTTKARKRRLTSTRSTKSASKPAVVSLLRARPPLPKRTPTAPSTPDFITHEAINAAYAARLAGLPGLPIRAWIAADSTIAADFRSGARLIHHPGSTTPFTALTPCPSGTHHVHPITTGNDLDEACRTAAACTSHHGRPTPDPTPDTAPTVQVNNLAPAFGHRNDTTESLSLAAIAAELAAHTDQPKEHPDHG